MNKKNLILELTTSEVLDDSVEVLVDKFKTYVKNLVEQEDYETLSAMQDKLLKIVNVLVIKYNRLPDSLRDLQINKLTRKIRDVSTGIWEDFDRDGFPDNWPRRTYPRAQILEEEEL